MAQEREFPRETEGMLHPEQARRKSTPPKVARKRPKRIAHRRRGKRG